MKTIYFDFIGLFRFYQLISFFLFLFFLFFVINNKSKKNH